MLTFQTDIDDHTGEQVLTCFLLPQLEYQNEQQGMTPSGFTCFLIFFFLFEESITLYILIVLCNFLLLRLIFIFSVLFVTFLGCLFLFSSP